MKKTDSNAESGFTLIELLVVIAIIGTLSSIVLSSITSARVKAYDAKVKAQMNNIRSAAELYYGANYNYGTSTLTATNGNGCATNAQAGMFADVNSGMSRVAMSANYPVGENTIICNSNGTAYAASDNLSTGNGYWCIDSAGNSVATSSPLATSSGATMGTLVCK